VGGNLTLGVAALLRTEIANGTWPLRSRLPTDADLARIHGVGMNTIRRAVGVLVAEGLVERRRGSGSLVVAMPQRDSPGPRVGLLVPTTSQYFPALVAGAESALRTAGGHLLLRSAERHAASELAALDELLGQQLDGLVLVPTLVGAIDPDSYLRRLAEVTVPLVIAERVPTVPYRRRLTHVVSDVVEAGRQAVEHLHARGCTKIALLSSRGTPTSEDFYAGYLAECEERDLSGRRMVLRSPGFDDNQLALFVRRLRAGGIDGLVCLGDVTAVQLLPHLRAARLSVPDDLAVITFEDDVAGDAEVPLTAVVPPRFEVGRLAVQLVLRAAELGPEAPVTHALLAPRVVQRQSTRRP